jgi:hypothetical protein
MLFTLVAFSSYFASLAGAIEPLPSGIFLALLDGEDFQLTLNQVHTFLPDRSYHTWIQGQEHEGYVPSSTDPLESRCVLELVRPSTPRPTEAENLDIRQGCRVKLVRLASQVVFEPPHEGDCPQRFAISCYNNSHTVLAHPALTLGTFMEAFGEGASIEWIPNHGVESYPVSDDFVTSTDDLAITDEADLL